MKRMRKKTESKRTKKDEFEDDGRTIVDMNVDGFSWYQPNRSPKREKGERSPSDRLSRKEVLALIGGAYKAMLPYILIAVGGLVVGFVVAALWL